MMISARIDHHQRPNDQRRHLAESRVRHGVMILIRFDMRFGVRRLWRRLKTGADGRHGGGFDLGRCSRATTAGHSGRYTHGRYAGHTYEKESIRRSSWKKISKKTRVFKMLNDTKKDKIHDEEKSQCTKKKKISELSLFVPSRYGSLDRPANALPKWLNDTKVRTRRDKLTFANPKMPICNSPNTCFLWVDDPQFYEDNIWEPFSILYPLFNYFDHETNSETKTGWTFFLLKNRSRSVFDSIIEKSIRHFCLFFDLENFDV